MMETFCPTTPSSSRTSDSEPHSSSSTSSPLPPSVLRLWRPAAQRNLRNQWSKLASFRNKWSSLSSAGRSHATSLVNSLLSLRYMPNMDLGVLSDMPDIRKKACFKLSKQQVALIYTALELLRSKLLSTYKDMVAVVSDFLNTTCSMRCFFKGANNSPLLRFSSFSEDKSGSGDGGGISAFSFLSIASHEKLAEELVQMFRWEICLKRFLIIELLSIGQDISQGNRLNWSDELYVGEFNHLQNCNLYCEETFEPIPPRLRGGKSDMEALKFDNQPKPEVYLTTWLAEVNIDTNRVDEIFAVVGEEMHVSIF